MPFRFTGDSPLLYSQYRDLGTDRPLLADPGGVYDIEAVGSWAGRVAVPPDDGRWEPAGDRPASPPVPPAADPPVPPAPPAASSTGGDEPPAPVNTATPEGEEN